MRTYIESICVALNKDYENKQEFICFDSAIEEFDFLKERHFQGIEPTIFESGSRIVQKEGQLLELYFIFKEVADQDFDMLHPASVADIQPTGFIL